MPAGTWWPAVLHPGSPAGSWASLRSNRKLIIHGGGQSRRLPAYAATGKLLMPVPVLRWSRGQRLDQTLLDLQLPEYERVLATVMFTDIVGSTEAAARLGDSDWRELLGRHHTIARAEIARFRGREVNTAGDGFIATFDGPARAVRCAGAMRSALQPLGIEIRAGVHTGEIELDGDDVGGIAVHICARVAAAAAAGETLVSSTVKDLVSGAGLAFTDRGAHALKGVPGEWRLFAAA